MGAHAVNRYGEGTSSFGFEDLDVYKAARAFRKRIYRLAKLLPEDGRHALARQMRRAAVSLTSNIAEGYGRHHWQENTQFCRQSRGSLLELIDDIKLDRLATDGCRHGSAGMNVWFKERDTVAISLQEDNLSFATLKTAKAKKKTKTKRE